MGTYSQLMKQETKKESNRKERKLKPAQKSEQKVEQKPTQKSEQKPLQTSGSLRPEDIEMLAFRLRKRQKTKVNAVVPIEWKAKLDDIAHKLRVGKYDLIMYLIAQFLGETESES